MNIELINKCIINLPERVDRLKQIEAELKWLFFDESHFLVSGIKHRETFTGIAQSHQTCIQMAKDNLFPYIIIIEDDCIFQAKEHTREYVYNALSNLPDQWDLLLGGIYETKGLTRYNDYWSKTKEFCALHFYIVHSNAYDKILSFDGSIHIDRWMASRGELNCYVTNKLFATQSNGYSDNAKQKVDYSNKLRTFDLL